MKETTSKGSVFGMVDETLLPPTPVDNVFHILHVPVVNKWLWDRDGKVIHVTVEYAAVNSTNSYVILTCGEERLALGLTCDLNEDAFKQAFEGLYVEKGKVYTESRYRRSYIENLPGMYVKFIWPEQGEVRELSRTYIESVSWCDICRLWEAGQIWPAAITVPDQNPEDLNKGFSWTVTIQYPPGLGLTIPLVDKPKEEKPVHRDLPLLIGNGNYGKSWTGVSYNNTGRIKTVTCPNCNTFTLKLDAYYETNNHFCDHCSTEWRISYSFTLPGLDFVALMTSKARAYRLSQINPDFAKKPIYIVEKVTIEDARRTRSMIDASEKYNVDRFNHINEFLLRPNVFIGIESDSTPSGVNVYAEGIMQYIGIELMDKVISDLNLSPNPDTHTTGDNNLILDYLLKKFNLSQ